MSRETENLKLSENIRAIDPVNPQADLIRQAAESIRQGKVVVFPTTCLYGLGADALNEHAVSKIFSIKGRPEAKPILALIGEMDMTKLLVRNIPPPARRIIDVFWPGEVTLVLEAAPGLPENLTAGTGKIGVRLPAHPVAAALALRAGTPITGTSANISGEGGCSKVSELSPLLASSVDMILDAGPLKGGAGSTIVDVSSEKVRILREGAVSAEDIFAVLSKL